MALILIAAVALVPLLSQTVASASAADYKDYDLSNPASGSNTVLDVEYFVTLLSGTESISDVEREYLKNAYSYITVKYDEPTADKISITALNDTVTVIAKPYTYIASNGITVTWNPISVVVEGTANTAEFTNNSGSYEAKLSGITITDSSAVVVKYEMDRSFEIDKDDLNSAFNYTYNEAERIKADYLAAEAAYRELEAEYAEKLKEYQEWEERQSPDKKQEAMDKYKQYLDDLAIYEEQLAKYNKYLSNLAAYQEKVDAYNAYLVALEEYNYYNNYKNLYPGLLDEYNLNVVAYREYTAKMDKIRAQLAVFETGLFEHVTYLERDLYSCIMGDTVNSVLNREDEIVAGVPSAKGAIKDAADATDILKSILTEYIGIESEAEKYAFYIANYTAIKENIILLTQTLYDLYRYDIVRTGVHTGVEGSGGKTDKYVIMVSQLILFANAISDETVYSYPDSKHAKIVLDKNTTIEYLTGELLPYKKVTKTALQILENNEYVKDTNSATPLSTGYPQYMEEPKEPTHPNDMPSVPKPTAVKKPGTAPTPVEEPVKPEEVMDPEKDVVEKPVAPVKPEVLNDANKALIAAFDEGAIVKRNTLESDYCFTPSVELTKSIINKDNVSVVFYGNDHTTVLSKVIAPLNSAVSYSGVVPSKPSTETEDYAFKGWVDASGNAVELNLVKTDIALYPSYSVTEFVNVKFFDTDGATVLSALRVKKGSAVTYTGKIPTKTDDVAVYTFDKWVDNYGNAVDLSSVNASVELYPQFTSINYIYVTFYGVDHTTVLYTHKLLPGQMAAYKGDTPVKESTADEDYTFIEWLDETGAYHDLSSVYHSLDLYPSFSVTKYIHINFYDLNGNKLESYRVRPNVPVKFNGEEPFKANTATVDYKFSGWTNNAGATFNKGAQIESNVSLDLYPVFTETHYVIVNFYGADNSTILSSVKALKGTGVVYDGGTPVKTGDDAVYTFDGWADMAGNRYGNSISAVDTSIDLYPVFKATYYVYVNFYAANKIDILHTVKLLPGQRAEFVGADPSKDSTDEADYTFAGWVDADGKTHNLAYVTESLDLYPQFTVTSYVVVKFYDAKGNLIEKHRVIPGTPVSFGASAPTKDSVDEADYVFSSWKDNNGDKYDLSNPRSSVELYPEFIEIPYIVIYFYDTDNETLILKKRVRPGTSVIFDGKTPEKISDNEELGYTFAGWQTKDGEEFELSAPTVSAELYPVFEETEYIVLHFYDFDTTTEILSIRILKGQPYSYTGRIPEKATEGNTEYDFSHWIDESGAEYDLTVAGYSAKLYPVFRETRYVNINFYDTDGTLLETQEHVRVGSTIVFNGVAPTKASTDEADYTFAGWMDSNGVRYFVVPDTDMDLEPAFDVTRFVVIRFYAADNTTVIYEARVLPNDPVSFVGSIPTKNSTDLEDYLFAGWILSDGAPANVVISSDVSLNIYPTYTTIAYALVNFYNYDNSLLATYKVRVGDSIVYDKANPVCPNTDLIDYAFSGWVDENGVEADLSKITSSVDFYADFSETHYVIVNFYDTDRTTLLYTQKVVKGSAVSYVGDLPVCSEGDGVYTFEKWVDVNGNSCDLSAVESTVDLYPDFNVIYYIYITFYAEDERTVLYRAKILPGQSVTYVGDIPSKDSTEEVEYAFAGWADQYGHLYDLTSVTEDVNLYPVFDPTYYVVVRFYSYDRQLLEQCRVLQGGDVVFNGATPTKPADDNGVYTFWRWMRSEDEEFRFENVCQSFNVYPEFKMTPYLNVVFYDSNRTTILYTQKVLLGGSMELPELVPVKENDELGRYTFSRWVDADGKAYDFGYVGENVELYPDFTRTPYIVITFVGADGDILDVQKIFPGEGPVVYGGTTPIKASIPVADYTFSGIWLDEDGEVFDLTNPTASATVYPDFTVTPYIVINFYAYDGVTVLESLRQRPDQKIVYSGSVPVRESVDYKYDFIGWTYADGAEYNFELLSESADFYPAFHKTPYVTVAFYDKDRLSVLYTTKVTQGTVISYVGELPVKESDEHFAYTFAYWADADGNKYDFSATATISVYPVFTSTPYITVNFYDLDGVKVLDTKRVLLGTVIVFEGALPSRESDLVYDYIFDAWVDEHGVAHDLSSITGSVDLYATLKSVLKDDYKLEVDETTGLNHYNVDLGDVDIEDIPVEAFIAFAAENRSVLNISLNDVTVRFAYSQVSAMLRANVAFVSVNVEIDGGATRANASYRAGRSSAGSAFVCTLILKDKDGRVIDDVATATITVDCQSADKAELYVISYVDADGNEISVAKHTEGSMIVFDAQNNVEYSFKIKYDVNVSAGLPLNIAVSVDNAAPGDVVTISFIDSIPLGTKIMVYYYDADSVKHVIKGNSFVMPEGDVLVGLELEDILYTVTFMSDGMILSQMQYKYGDTVDVPRNPVKQNDGTYSYTFSGWSEEITVVTGDVTYEAQFDSELLPDDGDDGVNKYAILLTIIIIVFAILIVSIILLIFSEKMTFAWKV